MSRNLASPAAAAPADAVARLVEVAVSPSDRDGASARITFSVESNALLFLVGPAGSGKSAVLDLLSFHALPKRGRVEIFGVDPARLAPAQRPRMRRRVGVVFQDQKLLPDLDVFANVALPARLEARGTRDFAQRVSELLVWVGLGGRGSDAIARLTEGERRRLCLARALINKPELLLLDEPTAGLADRAERSLLRLIGDVNAAGMPVIFATRNRSLAEQAGGSVFGMPAPAVAPGG